MRTIERRLARAVALAVAGCALIAACQDTDKLYEVEGDPIFQAPVDVGQAAGLPNGDLAITSWDLWSFNYDAPDAFGRATGKLGRYGQVTTIFAAPFDVAYGYDVTTHVAGNRVDPRRPAPTNAVGAARRLQFLAPSFLEEESIWDLSGYVDSLKANTTYTIVLARMATVVNGQLDAEERVVQGTVTEPDSLYFLGGTPGGTPSSACDMTVVTAINTNTNPVVLGQIRSNDSGTILVFGCLMAPVGNAPWWRSAGVTTPAPADSVPFGDNAFGGKVDLGQFNYLLVYEGSLTPAEVVTSAPAVRAQIGPDIDANGNAINNGFAPFPADAYTTEQLVKAPAGEGGPGGLRVRVYHLDGLTSGMTYQAWLYNPGTGAVVPAPVNWVIEEEIRELTDAGDLIIRYETVASGSSSTFPGQGGAGTFRHTFTVQTQSGGPRVGEFTHFLISIESGGPASSPSAAIPVWRQFTDERGTPQDFFDDAYIPGNINFGTFRMTGGLPYTFTPGGTARADFHGGNLRIVAERLSRPPVGYYYAGWLFNDNTGTAVYLGPLTTPPPGEVSLYDADVNTGLPGVTTDGIVRASVSATEASVGGKFYDYNAIRITLEPKSSPESVPAPTVIMAGPVPDPVLQQRPGGQ